MKINKQTSHTHEVMVMVMENGSVKPIITPNAIDDTNRESTLMRVFSTPEYSGEKEIYGKSTAIRVMHSTPF